MPTVQLYGGQKVEPTALPGVRKTAAETPESEGAGLDLAQARGDETLAAVAGQGVALGASLVGHLREQARLEADQVAGMESMSDLSSFVDKRLYDPATGAINVKGKAALGLPEQVLEDFDTHASGIAQGLNTDEQRRTFDKVAASSRQSLELTLRRHTNEQMQAYEGATLQSLVVNKRNEAISNATDPRRVGQALTDAVTAIRQSAPRLGLPPEEVQQQVEAAQTATLTGVIGRLIDNGQVKSAQTYFDETKDLIKGDALGRIEATLATGQTRAEGQQKADAIIAAGGTLSEQLEKAKGLDPDVRQVVEQRIEHANALKAATDRATAEVTLRGAYDILDQTGGDYTQIPTSVIATLPGSERSALQSYGVRLAAGEKTETDKPTYYALMTQASTDPEAFTKVNLLSSRAKLGDVEFKQLTELQYSIRKGDRAAADRELAPFNVNNEMVNDALTRYGLDPKSTDKAAIKSYATLRTMLRQNVTDLETLTGKKANDVDIQAQLDKILSTSEKVPGSWWGLNPFTSTHIKDTNKRPIDLTITDVPAGERTQIEAALKRSGRAVSDATVLEAYQQMQLRKPK